MKIPMFRKNGWNSLLETFKMTNRLNLTAHEYSLCSIVLFSTYYQFLVDYNVCFENTHNAIL